MLQFYSVPRVKKITGKDGKEKLQKEYRKIRLQNKRIVTEGAEIKIEESDADYEFFEVKGEYLNLKGDLDIRLTAESRKIPSKALDAQLAQQALAQLMPFAVNPNDPEGVKQNPLPLFNAVKIARWYAETNDLPEDVLLEKNVKPETQVLEALMQNVELNKGNKVAPQPGEIPEHIDVHDQQLAYWENEMANLTDQMAQQELETGTINRNIERTINEIQKVIDAYVAHIEGDRVSKVEESEYLISQAQPPMPQGGMMPPMPGGGMEQLPPMGGAPPMPPGMGQLPGAGGMPL